MASGIRFKPNYAGYRAVLNGSGCQAYVDKLAHEMADKAASGMSEDWGAPPREDHFEVVEFTGKKFGARGRIVATNTEHAKRHNARTKALTNAFKSMRKK